MSCNNFRLISKYADNELSDKEKDSLELHLKGCTHCSSRLEEVMAIKKSTAQVKAKPVSGEFWETLKARIAQQDSASFALQEKIPAFDLSRWSKRLIPVPVFFALAAVIVLILSPVDTNPVDEYIFGVSLKDVGSLLANGGIGLSSGSLIY